MKKFICKTWCNPFLACFFFLLFQTKQYVADFPTALEVNQTLSFHGTFTDQTTGVLVFRLQTTENYETPETIALELTIDFGLKKFIRNSFVDGKWGVKDTTGPFPFTDGDLFSFSLYVTETGFSITADGESVWTYAHRAPLDSVKHFVTKGSVDLEDVTVFRKSFSFISCLCIN